MDVNKKLLEKIGTEIGACTKCAKPMVIRQNSKNKSLFLGCSDYPFCTSTAELPEELKMRASGQPTLFD